jgi:hypothetical protein
VREPCDWLRASVAINTDELLNYGEYSLKLGFAKLAGSMGSIAIDNLSLSPVCFGVSYTDERHANESELIVPSTRVLELSLLSSMFGKSSDEGQGLLAVCFLVLSSFILLLCCLKIICYVRGRKQKPCLSADVHELIAIVSNSADNRPAANANDVCQFNDTHFGISGNPIYESLNLNPLKQIPRHSLKLDKYVIVFFYFLRFVLG